MDDVKINNVINFLFFKNINLINIIINRIKDFIKFNFLIIYFLISFEYNIIIMQLYKNFIFNFKVKKFIISIIIKFIINVYKSEKIINFFFIKFSFIFEIRYYKKNIIIK